MGQFRYIPDEAFGIKQIVRIRDIDAVVHNYLLFKDKADKTHSKCGAVIKGEMYGALFSDVGPALYKAGCRDFYVDELFEGVKLRSFIPQNDAYIYTTGGIVYGEEEAMLRYNITPCLASLEQLERWNDYCRVNGRGNAVIYFDTHMYRFGLIDAEVEYLTEHFDTLTSDINVLFYLSHFYDIKDTDDIRCVEQYKLFMTFIEKLPKRPLSFSSTDAVILLDKKYNMDMIRPGIGLVGGAPSADRPVSPDAKHVMEIYAKISVVKKVPKGETIGYGGAYTVKRDTVFAIVHIGYKDGYLRSYSETDKQHRGAYVYIGKYKCPLIGKVSMGVIMVDVTDIPESEMSRFKYAEIAGPNTDIKIIADICGCYEILHAMGRPNEKCADYTLTEFTEKFGNKMI